MKLLSMLGGLLDATYDTVGDKEYEVIYDATKKAFVGDWAWLQNIINVLNMIIFPILIVVASVGTIYAIYLGVMMAKAENAEKREEAKKRIINAVIAVAVMVVLILLLQLFVKFAPDILGLTKGKDHNYVDLNKPKSTIGLLKFMMMK